MEVKNDPKKLEKERWIRRANTNACKLIMQAQNRLLYFTFSNTIDHANLKLDSTPQAAYSATPHGGPDPGPFTMQGLKPVSNKIKERDKYGDTSLSRRREAARLKQTYKERLIQQHQTRMARVYNARMASLDNARARASTSHTGSSPPSPFSQPIAPIEGRRRGGRGGPTRHISTSTTSPQPQAGRSGCGKNHQSLHAMQAMGGSKQLNRQRTSNKMDFYLYPT